MRSSSRRDLIYLAKLAEQAERYDEMAEHMEQVAARGSELSKEERNLLSIAYKNVIGAHRASWRNVTSLERREESQGDAVHLEMVVEYREQIEVELAEICRHAIGVIEKYLIPTASGVENKVFYTKMLADYQRYLAEFTDGEQRENASNASVKAYLTATEIASPLVPTHPMRLGVALNHSVFYYEIVGDTKHACDLARSAFDSAIARLDCLTEESYKDSTLILQLLRDNLTLWSSNAEKEESAKKESDNPT